MQGGITCTLNADAVQLAQPGCPLAAGIVLRIFQDQRRPA